MTDGTRSYVEESKGNCLQPSHKLPFLSQPTTTTTGISLYKSRLYIKTTLKRGFHVQVSRTKAPEGKMGGDLNIKVAFEAPELVQARLVHCARCAPSAREKFFPASKRCHPAKTGPRQTAAHRHPPGGSPRLPAVRRGPGRNRPVAHRNHRHNAQERSSCAAVWRRDPSTCFLSKRTGRSRIFRRTK